MDLKAAGASLKADESNIKSLVLASKQKVLPYDADLAFGCGYFNNKDFS